MNAPRAYDRLVGGVFFLLCAGGVVWGLQALRVAVDLQTVTLLRQDWICAGARDSARGSECTILIRK